MNELFWNYFKNTGNINAYLYYRELSGSDDCNNSEEVTNDCKG